MDVERIVRTHITAEDSSAPPAEIVAGIHDGKLGLLDVVKASGEYITDTDDAVRVKGISLLTNVIKTAPPNRINRQATQVLTGFYCDKLEDDPVLPSALEALTVLAALPTFGEGECMKVYRTVVETVKMRSCVQSTRYLVFKLVDTLLAKHRQAFKNIGDDFIASYVKLAEGEKDPRNLLLAFSIDHVVLVDFDISKHLEDLYDIVFCYFPITFRPPPDDPYGITTDDLKLALRKCMAATSRFGPLAMPLFLEKLPPSLGATKRDILQSLTACLPVYGSTMILGFMSELWESLKTEIFYSPDAQIEADASETLQTVIRVLYPTPQHKASGLAEEVIKECAELLKEPEKSKAKPATRTLVACIKASGSVGSFALSQVLPQMFRQYHTESEIPHRGPILAVIGDLLKALRDVYTTSDSRTQAAEQSIERYRDELLSIISAGMEDTSPAVQKPALDALINLVHIPDFVTETEVAFLVQKINDLVIEAPTDELRSEAIAALKAIAQLSPNSVANISLPLLFGKLPDRAPPLAAGEERAQYRRILASLSSLCVAPGLFETLIIRVLTKMDLLCEVPLPLADTMDIEPSEEQQVERECNIAYAHALLASLLNTLRSKVQANHKDVAKYFDQVVPRMFSIFVPASVSNPPPLAADVRLLGVAASIIEVMTQTLTQERQSQFAKVLFAAYINGQMLALFHQANKPRDLRDIRPLEATATVREQNLVILFSAGVVALRPEVDVAVDDPNAFLVHLVDWHVHTARSNRQRLATSHILASAVNKNAPNLDGLLGHVEKRLWQDVTTAGEQRGHALKLWIWIARGLITRGHPSGLSMVAQVFEIFESGDDFALEAAASLSILAEKSGDDVLSKANHAVVKALARQKMFNTILPIIVKGCKVHDSNELSRKAYLTAFGSIVRIIPRSTIVTELAALLPLMLQSLQLPDAKMRANLIDSLTGIMESADSSSDKAIHDQAKTLVLTLLKIATGTNDASCDERCRIAALRCLGVFPDVVRFESVQNVKAAVIRDLALALDDPKRMVRREAVDSRARWYRYGAAT